jgi:hypothetical protein
MTLTTLVDYINSGSNDFRTRLEPVVQAVIEKAKLGTCWDANRIRNSNRSFLAIS